MLKLIIKYNKKKNIWLTFINKYLFITLKVGNNIGYINNVNIKYSKIFIKYFLLLKILRQYGLIRSIKNLKKY